MITYFVIVSTSCLIAMAISLFNIAGSLEKIASAEIDSEA